MLWYNQSFAQMSLLGTFSQVSNMAHGPLAFCSHRLLDSQSLLDFLLCRDV